MAQLRHPDKEVAVPLWQGRAHNAEPREQGIEHPLLGYPAYRLGAVWQSGAGVLSGLHQLGHSPTEHAHPRRQASAAHKGCPGCIYLGRGFCSRRSRTGAHSLGAKPGCRLCKGDGP